MQQQLLRSRYPWLSLFLLLCSCRPEPPATHGPIPQDAYLWQRQWNKPVAEAITNHGAAFRSLVFLAAEVSWKKGEPQVARAAVDYGLVRAANCALGLAVRIGPFPGPFSATDKTGRRLAELCHSLLAECADHGVAISELQIDFDCAAARLEGYRRWIEAIRQEVQRTPIVITTLPSWLDQKAFGALIAATDGFVLQVHSLERPKSARAPFDLCDAKLARKAAVRAARLGRPFRVALPTYGYALAFDRNEKFLGLNADGPERVWPADALLRETRADPAAMAELVRDWTASRPQALAGVIWYRLPVRGEALNWSWPTLAAVMAGREPKEAIRLEARRQQDGLFELVLHNDGERSATAPVTAGMEWAGGRLIAGDGLAGYELQSQSGSKAILAPRQPQPLGPGETRKIGWLRLDQTNEISTRLFERP